MKKHIPNSITLANLFCGCCAIVEILHGKIDIAAYFIAAALLLDWLDGTVARMMKICNPVGRELDSMADMVSFGVVPGMILFQILSDFDGKDAQILAMPAFVLSAFSGLRLAKFNLDTRQTDSFIGLPTPSCTMFILGIGLGYHQNGVLFGELAQNPLWIYALVAVFSFLLVAEIPMYSIKFKKANLPIIGFALLASIGLIWYFGGIGLSILIGGYILSSLLFFRKKLD
jgi:CDP-diacylglycerol---serine O-phosphatidyltransferase